VKVASNLLDGYLGTYTLITDPKRK